MMPTEKEQLGIGLCDVCDKPPNPEGVDPDDDPEEPTPSGSQNYMEPKVEVIKEEDGDTPDNGNPVKG